MVKCRAIYDSVIHGIQSFYFQYKKQLFLLGAIYLLAFCAIFRANFSYVDDVGRTYAGYHGWLDWSRWGTEILATLVHANWHLGDISPIPQILACGIMAVGGIVLLDLFRQEEKVTFWHVFAASLTALAPYFLGIISYKFDSPYMSLSFLASILPFLFRRQSGKIYAVISVLSLLVMCTTYQASSGIYPMTAVFLALQDMIMGKSVKKCTGFLGLSGVCYFISLGIFWLFLMRENGVAVASGLAVIPFAIHRYISYYQMIYSDFTWIWLALLFLLFFCFLLAIWKGAAICRLLALLLGCLAVLAGSFLCFGAYLFISEEAYDTRAMYGFNVLLTLMAVFISFHLKSWIGKAVYTSLGWSFFVFALIYGNALAQQKNYMNYRVGLLAEDLNHLEFMKGDEIKAFQIKGDIGVSPVITNMIEDYPLLGRTIFTGLSEGFWGEYYFLHYLNIPGIESAREGNGGGSLPVIKDTMYHTIKGNEYNIVIELK